MGCGCGGRSYTRRSSMVVRHNPAQQPARTMNPPQQHAPSGQTPPHIVQSAALAARRNATIRRQV